LVITMGNKIGFSVEVINGTVPHSRVFVGLSHNDATAPGIHRFFLFIKVRATDVFGAAYDCFVSAFQSPATKINGGKQVVIAVSTINKGSLYGTTFGMVVGRSQFSLLLRDAIPFLWFGQ